MAAPIPTYKILIADGSVILNNLLRDVFEENAFEVSQAFDGAECKALFLKDQPDVVLVDGRMPRTDCIDVLKYVRQRAPRTVMIITTSEGNEQLALKALKAGADDYLQKPFGNEEVVDVVSRLLERRRVEEENAKLNSQILKRERYLAELTTVINEALITTDVKGRIQFMNRAGSEMWGYSTQELKDKDVHLLVRGEARTLLYRNLVNDTIRKGKLEGEFLFRKKDKGTFPGYLSSSVMKENQRIKGIVFVVADLSRVYEVEARLKQSEKLASLGRVAEGIAHEVRNTLTSLGGFALRLNKSLATEQTLSQYTSIILDDVHRLEKMVQTIEDYVRFARFHKFNFALTRLPLLVERARERVLQTIEKEKADAVAFNLKVEEGLPAIQADPTALQEAFYHLIMNAYEAMPKGGRLTVTLKHVDSAVSISFSDTGVGIDSTYLHDIFNPFFTAKTTGAGMGLSKVHLLVEEHRGTIKVSSTLSRGTTFEVLLPVERLMRGDQPLETGGTGESPG
jgi:two-component system, cell cycle sensor histidine kinase and response regulator CckA